MADVLPASDAVMTAMPEPQPEEAEAAAVSPPLDGVAAAVAEPDLEKVEVEGDYRWTSQDGEAEGLLRLRPGGQFWHAVHRATSERGRIVGSGSRSRRRAKPPAQTNIWKAYKGDFGPAGERDGVQDLAGDYEEIDIWEIAESLGSWVPVELSGDGSHAALGRAVLLTCEHWHWKSSHPTAPSSLRPTEASRDELDAMVDAGQLILCYSASQDKSTGVKTLELQMQSDRIVGPADSPSSKLPRHIRMRSVQAAFQTLGFARLYEQRPGEVPPS